jgi:Type II restriction endonuclease, TdeIII
MKQRLLTAPAIRRDESTRTWWGVPYNPYGRGEYRWVYPLAFFDFEDEVMLGLRSGTLLAASGHTRSFSICIGKLATSSPNGFANFVTSSEDERAAR